MYVPNITEDYDNITDLNFTNNCTDIENNFIYLCQHFYYQNHLVYNFYV